MLFVSACSNNKINYSNCDWICVSFSCMVVIWDHLSHTQLGFSVGNPGWQDLCTGVFIKYLLYLYLCAVSLCQRVALPPPACLSHFSPYVSTHGLTHPQTQRHSHSEAASASLMFRSPLVFLLHQECSLVTGDFTEREDSEWCVCYCDREGITDCEINWRE